MTTTDDARTRALVAMDIIDRVCPGYQTAKDAIRTALQACQSSVAGNLATITPEEMMRARALNTMPYQDGAVFYVWCAENEDAIRAAFKPRSAIQHSESTVTPDEALEVLDWFDRSYKDERYHEAEDCLNIIRQLLKERAEGK